MLPCVGPDGPLYSDRKIYTLDVNAKLITGVDNIRLDKLYLKPINSPDTFIGAYSE